MTPPRLSAYTASALEQLLGLDPGSIRFIGRRKPMNIIVRATLDGFPVEIHLSPTEIIDNAAFPPIGTFKMLIDNLREEGMAPATTAPKPAPASPPPTTPQRPAPPQPARRPPGQQAPWSCPYHGNQNVGPGFRGQGWACNVWTTDPDTDDPNREWIQLDAQFEPIARQLNNGTTRYYCRFKSTSK